MVSVPVKLGFVVKVRVTPVLTTTLSPLTGAAFVSLHLHVFQLEVVVIVQVAPNAPLKKCEKSNNAAINLPIASPFLNKIHQNIPKYRIVVTSISVNSVKKGWY
jgi:hypothetical protein